MLTYAIIERDLAHEEEDEVITIASDIFEFVPDLKDGWPFKIETSLGNGLPFVLQAADSKADIRRIYGQPLSPKTLKIFND